MSGPFWIALGLAAFIIIGVFGFLIVRRNS